MFKQHKKIFKPTSLVSEMVQKGIKEREETIKNLEKLISHEMGNAYQVRLTRDALIAVFRGEEYKVKYSLIMEKGLRMTFDGIKQHFNYY